MAWILADFAGTYWRTIKLLAAYVSPVGDDRNDGHPKRPVRTVARAGQIASLAVCAPGTYTDKLISISVTSDQGSTIFEGGGTGVFTYGGTITGITVQNYSTLANGGSLKADNCEFRNIPAFNVAGTANLGYIFHEIRNSLIVNSFKYSNAAYTYSTMQFVGNTLINSRFFAYYLPGGATTSIRDCIADAASVFDLPVRDSYGNLISLYLDYCGLNGSFNLPAAGGSTTQVADLTALRAHADWGSIFGRTLVNGPNLDFGFANEAAGDYTLRTDSVVRNDSLAGSYIGCFAIGFSHTNPDDVDEAVNARFDTTLQAWVPIDPTQDMVVEYNWKNYGQSWALQGCVLLGQENVVQGQTIDATLSYAASAGVAVDTVSGNIAPNVTYWVKDYASVTYNGQQYTTDQYFVGIDGISTYTSNGTGKVVQIVETPNARVLDYLYAVAAGTLLQARAEGEARGWKRLVLNRAPTWNVSTGYTNGEVLFDPATAEPLVVAWGKPRITLLANSLP